MLTVEEGMTPKSDRMRELKMVKEEDNSDLSHYEGEDSNFKALEMARKKKNDVFSTM